jgi:RIO kinase 1
MRDYYSQFAPALANTEYAKEMWGLFEKGELTSDTELSGEFVEQDTVADIAAIMQEIDAAREEELARKERLKEAQQGVDETKFNWAD